MALLVNGEYLDENAIREECELIRRRLAQEMPDETGLSIDVKAREWAMENVIERVLLRQAAEQHAETTSTGESGCTTVVSQQSLKTGAEGDGRLEKLLARVTRNVVKPKKKEVAEFYGKNKALFFTPEQAHASHIVKNVDEHSAEARARAVIETAQAELQEGKPFTAVADQYSDCPGSGGELGWFSRGEMVDEFEAVVFGLQPGEVSGIFRSPFGFHVATLHERKPAGVRPLPEVYGQVEELILNQKRQDAIERFLDELRSKAEIRRVPSRKADART